MSSREIANPEDTLGRLRFAYYVYQQRQRGETFPSGRFDKGGRWYPDEGEYMPCCDHVSRPSQAYPWSLYLHCLTIRHIAHLYEVDELELRRFIRREGK
jgi:hypothetical protein